MNGEWLLERDRVPDWLIRRRIRALLAHKKSGGQEQQALGRSRGGFNCKIHVTVDALGNPLRLRLTAGQRHDSTQDKALVDGFDFRRVIADRGYAATDFIDYLMSRGIQAVIPLTNAQR